MGLFEGEEKVGLGNEEWPLLRCMGEPEGRIEAALEDGIQLLRIVEDLAMMGTLPEETDRAMLEAM